MDFAQNQVARGMDTAHVFGIATEIGMVRARSLAEGLHEHVVGNLFYRLLVGIDNVDGVRQMSAWLSHVWLQARSKVQRMKGLSVGMSSSGASANHALLPAAWQ